VRKLQFIMAGFTIVGFAIASIAVHRARAASFAMLQLYGSCVSYLPQSWGQYKGGSN
jgi:hypothetical protein